MSDGAEKAVRGLGRLNVILAGPMGCGKTTTGEALARRLGMPFLDTDRLIEAESGRSIRELFETRGEMGFRSLERAAVRKACRLRNTVVAVGGGALIDRRNLALVKHSGVTIGLIASPEVILERARGDADRPLMSGHSGEKRLPRIQELLEARRSSLEELDSVIDTSSTSVPECLETVLAVLEEKRFPPIDAVAEDIASAGVARTVRVSLAGGDKLPCPGRRGSPREVWRPLEGYGGLARHPGGPDPHHNQSPARLALRVPSRGILEDGRIPVRHSDPP